MINFKEIYEERIIQINKDIKKLYIKKDWKAIAVLNAEKKKLEDRIKDWK